MSFTGQVLGPKQLAMTVLSRSFPELGLAESELSEGELARVGGEVRRAQLGRDSRASRTGSPERESTRRGSRRTIGLRAGADLVAGRGQDRPVHAVDGAGGGVHPAGPLRRCHGADRERRHAVPSPRGVPTL